MNTQTIPQAAPQDAGTMDRDAAIVTRLQALAEAYVVPGLRAAERAIEWHYIHSKRPSRFARIAYLSALSFASICKFTPLSVLEERNMSEICDGDRRYHRNYDLLSRLVVKGCIRRGELPVRVGEGRP